MIVAGLEQQLQCTHLCVSTNGVASAELISGTTGDTALNEALLRFTDSSTTYVFGTDISNVGVAYIFSENTTDEQLITVSSPDCIDRGLEELRKLLNLINYILIAFGVLFVLSGISCFCYMKNKKSSEQDS